MSLEEGDAAPAFSLPDQDGRLVSLSDYLGRRVVVYFYPRDDTPGCTTEACQFNDALTQFGSANVDVIGISPDDAQSHRDFRAKFHLRFPLLTDADHQVHDAYSTWGEKTMAGRTFMGTIRSTFVVDAAGKIEHAWYGVTADGHAGRILAEIGG
ncbi:MAG: thioredoxin-dependent thiol peroxidase [Candidatus Dormibacteraceae bacterium]